MRRIAFRVEPEKRLSSACGSETERAVLVKYWADTAHPAMAERMVFKAAGVILHLWEKAERRMYDPSYTKMKLSAIHSGNKHSNDAPLHLY